MSEVEEWRPVVGWDGYYEVSSQGRVRSLDRVEKYETPQTEREVSRIRYGRMMRLKTTKFGYLTVGLRRLNEKPKWKFVHRLVCEAFVGPAPAGHEVAHNDGDRANACVGNLRWATRSDNHADMIGHGTARAGTQNGRSKLSPEAVAQIRAAVGVRQVDLARKFGVGQSQIGRIRRGESRANKRYP